jgi:hypothetical protein
VGRSRRFAFHSHDACLCEVRPRANEAAALGHKRVYVYNEGDAALLDYIHRQRFHISCYVADTSQCCGNVSVDLSGMLRQIPQLNRFRFGGDFPLRIFDRSHFCVESEIEGLVRVFLDFERIPAQADAIRSL